MCARCSETNKIEKIVKLEIRRKERDRETYLCQIKDEKLLKIKIKLVYVPKEYYSDVTGR